MSTANSNKPSSPPPTIKQRRLTRQGRLRYLRDKDAGLHSTTSLPSSPLPSFKSASASDHWSCSAVPQPLPRPDSPLTRRYDNHHLGSPPFEHPGFAFPRRSVDHDAARSIRSASNLGRPSFDPVASNAKHDLRVNIPPARVLAGNTSSCKDHTEHSQDNDSENVSNLRLHFSAKSAPNSIFSSPVTSPRRSSNVDFYDPSIIFPQDFNDILRVSPAKTAQSPDRTPLRSPGSLLNPEGCQSQLHKLSSWVLPENNHVDAHPLPLPPRASPPPAQSSPQHQPSIVHLTVENSPSMKGQWQKGKLIGRGSYGSVYHATNLETGASCAMKEVEMFLDDPKSADCIKQLEQEIRILRQLHHPNIVQYYGSELDGDRLYIYMEYVHPGSLDKFMHEHCGAMTESVVRNFTRHILSGLAYLHSTKTIHSIHVATWREERNVKVGERHVVLKPTIDKKYKMQMRLVDLVFKVLKYPKKGILKLASLRASVHWRVERTMDLRESISNQTDVALSMTKLLLAKEGREKNFVYSPLSLHVVLSIIAAGSNGPTLDQLLSFLRSKSTHHLNSFASQLVTVVLSDAYPTGGPRLSFASGVWVEQTLSLLPSFKHLVNTDYKATLASVDFQTKAVEVANEVNSWAEKETNSLIKELLPAGSVDSTTRLIFANALYFKGAWNEKFDASITKDHDFHLLDGNSVKVPFMTSKKKQFIRPFDGFKVLGLPYKQGEDKRQFSMYFFLPDAKDGLPALAEKLASESGFLERKLPNQKVKVGEFRIPRFKISFGFEASDVLKELGVVLPFTVGGLTEMVESPAGQNLCVSDIFHKSFIEVNEEGTEAAAATAATVLLRSALDSSKIDFVADHPFLFLIREDLTGTVLFIGQVLDPRAG